MDEFIHKSLAIFGAFLERRDPTPEPLELLKLQLGTGKVRYRYRCIGSFWDWKQIIDVFSLFKFLAKIKM